MVPIIERLMRKSSVSGGMRGRDSLPGVVLVLSIYSAILIGSCHATEVSKGDGNINRTTEVFFLQVSERLTIKSYAIWKQNLDQDLKAFTLCYRIKIFFYRPEVTVFSFMGSNGLKIRVGHNRRAMQVLLSRQHYRVVTDIVTPLLFWSSFCIGFDSHVKTFAIVYNGEKWKSKGAELPVFEPEDEILMENGGSIVLGQDQDIQRGGFEASQSFCGQITGVNLWSTKLTEQQMIDVTSCQTDLRGDIINWETSEWILGADTKREDYNFLRSCRIDPIPYFFIEEKLKFSDSDKICRVLGGHVVLPTNQEEQDLIYSLALKEGSECLKTGSALIWIGITDIKEEGVWRDIRNATGREISYENWAIGQPNGDGVENCAVIKANVYNGAWADIPCSKSFQQCVMCELEMPVFIRFRGICDANLYDDRYMMKGKRNNMPYFRGYYRSHVFYNGTTWVLENIMKDDIHATMEESSSFNFPMGRHDWRFTHGFCGKKPFSLHSLTLTQCEKEAEFTCNDGTCIPIREVCDRQEQCPDESDELDCGTVKPTPGYQPTLPPPNSEPGKPLPVYLNLTINSFGYIDAVNNKFTVEVLLRMIWRDKRLHFKHLRRDRQLNIILPTEAESMWIPVVDFLITEDSEHTRLDDESKLTIKRLGKPLPDNIEESKEARVYLGSENYIQLSRIYTITFTCRFNFFNYPFNTDYCHMIFRNKKNTDTYVALKMLGPEVRYEGKSQLVEYKVGKMHLERFFVEDEPYSGLALTIQLKHMFATQVVTIFTPLTLFNLIGYTTFFYKWFDFQNRVIVTLTSVLVMTTLFAQVSDNLPKTSYTKMIDIWFLFSISFNFFIMMFHTLIEFSHKYKNPGEIANMEGTSFRRPDSPEIKLMSTTDRPSDTNSIVFEPNDEMNPYLWPKRFNRLGYIISLLLYISFLIGFWSTTLYEKSIQETWDIQEPSKETYGYPD